MKKSCENCGRRIKNKTQSSSLGKCSKWSLSIYKDSPPCNSWIEEVKAMGFHERPIFGDSTHIKINGAGR